MAELLRRLQLILRHRGPVAGECPGICLEFENAESLEYQLCLQSRKVPFEAEFMRLRAGLWDGDRPAEVEIVAEIVRGSAGGTPVLETEEQFARRLVARMAGPWIIRRRQVIHPASLTVIFLGEGVEMRTEDLDRLEAAWRAQQQALRAVKHMRGETGRRRYRRGPRTAQRGARATVAEIGGSEGSADRSVEESWPEPDHPAEEGPEPQAEVAPSPAGVVGPEESPSGAAGPRATRGRQWGPYQLAEVYLRGRLVGAGATCGLHLDEHVGTTCKKSLRFGTQNLSLPTCYLRLKRWLLAGRHLPAGARAEHVSMGGPQLRDFAEGLSEAELDALVGQPSPTALQAPVAWWLGGWLVCARSGVQCAGPWRGWLGSALLVDAEGGGCRGREIRREGGQWRGRRVCGSLVDGSAVLTGVREGWAAGSPSLAPLGQDRHDLRLRPGPRRWLGGAASGPGP